VRFVIDTNLIVAGIISSGLPRQLLDAARAGHFELCTSDALLAELQRVLGRAKFNTRLAGQTPEALVADLRKLAIVVAPNSVPRVVPTDPDDDHVLAAALAGAADLIASGDARDLLPLNIYAGIPIVTARQAWERLALQA
jgi:putative PIN family toxin of toxin-antitoxin system